VPIIIQQNNFASLLTAFILSNNIDAGRRIMSMANKTVQKVVIYSTPTCPICKRAKEYLSKNGVPYQDIDVAADKEAAREMIHKSGQMGVPVIFVDDKMMVGFNQAKLDELLAK
jgi:glutaredoxin-like YruB-family protein